MWFLFTPRANSTGDIYHCIDYDIDHYINHYIDYDVNYDIDNYNDSSRCLADSGR